jgi:hypothetical protein
MTTERQIELQPIEELSAEELAAVAGGSAAAKLTAQVATASAPEPPPYIPEDPRASL